MPLRPASPQEYPAAPLSLLPPTPALPKDTHPAIQLLEASGSDTIQPLATNASDAFRDTEDHVVARPGIPRAISRRLYFSHFLSTWNSRSFAFGADLFLASIFPATLLPLSIYELVRSASAIIFAPIIGHAIDGRDRLQVVRFSIGKLPTSTVESIFCNLYGIQKDC